MNSVLRMTENSGTPQTLIAIYCGSRSGNNPIYLEKAIELAQQLAQQNFWHCLRRCKYWTDGKNRRYRFGSWQRGGWCDS